MANARLGWFSLLGLAASILASAGRVGLRVHRFRFSACTDSEWLLGEFVLPPSASEIAVQQVGLRAHCFRFSARTASEIALGGLVLPPSVSEIPLGELAFGSLLPLFGTRCFGVAAGRVRSSAFRFGDCPRRIGSSSFRFGDSARRVGLRAHRFRFSVRPASEIAAGRVGLRAHCFGDCRSASSFFRLPFRKLPSAGWPSGSLLPLFGTPRFGDCRRASWPSGSLLRRLPFGEFVLPSSVSEIALGGLVFGLIASAFRHAPIRGGRWASWFFRLPFRRFRSAGWSSGSLLPLFGMHRSAPPRRRREDRRSTPTRHLFHFKTLIPTC